MIPQLWNCAPARFYGYGNAPFANPTESSMKVHTITTEIWLPRPREEIFAFFSDAANLEILTPPWLHFRILTPLPVAMRSQAEIEYCIRWRGIPLSWRTCISVWEPPHRFIDQQVRGPYRQWIHEHTFTEVQGGTLMRDRVDYAVPGWFLEPLLHAAIVAPDIERIFMYRHKKMEEIFGSRSTPLPQGAFS